MELKKVVHNCFIIDMKKTKCMKSSQWVWSALISGHLVKYQGLKEILSAKSKKIKMAQQVKHLFT